MPPRTAALPDQDRPPPDAIGGRPEDELTQPEHDHVQAQRELDDIGAGVEDSRHGWNDWQIDIHRQ